VRLGVRKNKAAATISKRRAKVAGQTLLPPDPREPSPGEACRCWSLTMCSSSLEEVILAEDETDGEQRHPFDGNCSEPGSGVGPRGERSSQCWGDGLFGSEGLPGDGCSEPR